MLQNLLGVKNHSEEGKNKTKQNNNNEMIFTLIITKHFSNKVVAAQRLWNNLPFLVSFSGSLYIFKKRLKTVNT